VPGTASFVCHDEKKIKPVNIQDVVFPVSEELKSFRQKYKTALETENSLIDKVVRYILKQQGKQIRPVLVMLGAKVCGGVEERHTGLP